MSLPIAESHPTAAESILFLHGGNVAGWMWTGQVEALPDRHCLVPDLPGFGAAADLDWISLADTADRLAALITERAHGGTCHVVGMSLGAVVGTTLIARHPRLVRSALLTSAPLRGISGPARWTGGLQLRLGQHRWYWAALARAFRIPAEEAERFIATGLAIRPENARRMQLEVYEGLVRQHLDGLIGCTVPILALAGAKDSRVVRDSFPELTTRATAVTTRLVPGMHHAWNAEDPVLFNRVLRHWLDHRQPVPSLIPLGTDEIAADQPR